MLRDDRSYFTRREAEERAAARRATCPQAAAAHREMAERYAEFIDNLSERPEAETAYSAARSASPDGTLGSLAPFRK